ncbi:MAG TPA: LysR substrate-binding domain-containing protein [Stellaceae bacterium]|nr:LysR substrate-binding domain-containing protein [Stellaceae bacterium]
MVRTNLDMDVLRTFAVGMELGSFARAAERLGRSQAAVSAQLKKLEEQTGETLFKKAGRGLALTDAGEALLSYARRMLELNDEAVAAVRGAQIEGWVRLGLPQDFAEAWLPSVLGRFIRAHPRVRIEAKVERNSELVRNVIAGTLDLALVWGDGPDLPRAERLTAFPMVWIGAASEDLASLRAADAALPLVLFDQPCVFRTAGIAALDGAGISWRIAFITPSLSGLLAATAAGLGITLRTPMGLPANLTVLDPESAALPPLPRIAVSVCAADADPAPATARLAAILRETILSGAAAAAPQP